MRLKKTIVSLKRFLDPKYQVLFADYKVNMKPRYGHGTPPNSMLYSIINEHREDYESILKEALKYKQTFLGINKANAESNAMKPVYNNGFFPGLDIIALYTMVALFKPGKYIEVGSGNSTKVAYQSIKDNNLSTEILSIDPCPRAEIDTLSNKIIRKPFEDIDCEFLFSLKENDILFIDNSHRILPNSDSMVFYLELLPRLSKGIIVYIHDIYLPYDYPQFMCDRFYTEQYGLAMYLLANSARYKTLLPNYFIYQDPELSSILEPIWNHPNLQDVESHGGSFWLQIQ